MNIDISPLFTAIASNINIDRKAVTYVCVTALDDCQASIGG